MRARSATRRAADNQRDSISAASVAHGRALPQRQRQGAACSAIALASFALRPDHGSCSDDDFQLRPSRLAPALDTDLHQRDGARRMQRERRCWRRRPSSTAASQRRASRDQAHHAMGRIQRAHRSHRERRAAPTGVRLHRAGRLPRRRRGQEGRCALHDRCPQLPGGTGPGPGAVDPGAQRGRPQQKRGTTRQGSGRAAGHLHRSLGATPRC